MGDKASKQLRRFNPDPTYPFTVPEFSKYLGWARHCRGHSESSQVLEGTGQAEREGPLQVLRLRKVGRGRRGPRSLRDPLWAWLSWLYPLNAEGWSAGLQRSRKPERVGEERGGKKMLPTPGSLVRGPSPCRCPLFHVWEKSLSFFASGEAKAAR